MIQMEHLEFAFVIISSNFVINFVNIKVCNLWGLFPLGSFMFAFEVEHDLSAIVSRDISSLEERKRTVNWNIVKVCF